MEKINIRLNQYSSTSMQLENENFNIIVDRPIQKGGSGKGLMGGQHLLLGVGGCFCSTLFATAISRGINISGLKVNVIATISNVPKRFNNIDLEVSYNHCSHPEEFNKLLIISEKGCISINTLKKETTFNISKK